MDGAAFGYLDANDLSVTIDEVQITKRDDNMSGNYLEPFGGEDFAAMRASRALEPAMRDSGSAIAEAVRHIHFTGELSKRNVRIRNNYTAVDYWDGRDWWMIGIHEALLRLVGVAIRELEHCAGSGSEFAAYMDDYRRDAALQESVRTRVLEVLIRPFPYGRD